MEDNILEMFLEDTREHLADIETDLLDIEEAGPDFDPELVNKVFRTAHSIKGSAGFLALDNIRDLSHKIENVLDMVRSRELQPTSEVVNVILKGFDRLQELVDNVHESDSMDISEHVGVLTTLVQSGLPEERKADVTSPANLNLPDGRELFNISAHDMKQARKGGNYIYMVEYDLIHDVHQQNKTPIDLMKSLEKSGLILDCKTDIRSVGDLDSELSNRIPFYVLYATILEPELCKAIFQVDEKYIHHIREDEKPPQPEMPQEVKQERKPVSAADLDDLERQLDMALARRPPAGGSVEPLTPHPSLTSGYANGNPGVARNSARQPDEELERASEPEAAPEPVQTQAAEGEPFELNGEFFSLNGSGKNGVLSLSGQATIENSGALRQAMLDGIERCESLTLDLSGVEQADLALLQLLFAARHSARNKGGSLKIAENVPESVQEVARRAGFSHRMQNGFQGIFSN